VSSECNMKALWVPSPNFDTRATGAEIKHLILHYTGMKSAEAAQDRLCDPTAKVSSHYLIDEKGAITQMVLEKDRAWHAGVSNWAGESDINSTSIGIEIHNRGHEFGYEEYPDVQITAVIDLCRDILTRHNIAPHHILAHSDIAPARKQDPGEKFPWEKVDGVADSSTITTLHSLIKNMTKA